MYTESYTKQDHQIAFERAIYLHYVDLMLTNMVKVSHDKFIELVHHVNYTKSTTRTSNYKYRLADSVTTWNTYGVTILGQEWEEESKDGYGTLKSYWVNKDYFVYRC